ncbi:MAG: hypothetical protein WBD12_01015, partial [Candidatus Omnitrophota bacterium]
MKSNIKSTYTVPDPGGVFSRTGDRNVKPWLRTISMAVIITFLFQQITFGQVQPPATQPLVKDRIDLNQVSIPRDIAITKDINKTPSKELIINIKDVHDNFGAQESIVSVLDNLAVNYDVSFVGIEGAEGYIDMSVISAFPDEEAKKKASEYLMQTGKISAGEFFAALSDTPVNLYGIDDSDLYLKNYNAFMGLLDEKERNMKIVDSLRNALYALEDQILSEELKQLNRNSVLNNRKGAQFTRRWGQIKKIGDKHGVKYENYPNINALMQAVEAEKKIDYRTTNKQRDDVLDILAKQLKRDPLEEMILKSLSFKLGKISKSQFYSYILFTCKVEEVDPKHYSELEAFCNYVNLYESIDLGALMDEIDDYENKAREKLYRNKDERELTALLKDTEILHNVFEVKLTSGQLRYFEAHMDNFRLSRFMDFIKSSYKKYGMPLPADLGETNKLFDQLPQAVDFYEAATGRNRAMVDNTIKYMKENGATVGAIITGGFHTRGVTDILKSDDLSYIILLPRFNARTGKRPYITILTNKTNEYKKYIESEEFLAATSFHAVNRRILDNSRTGQMSNLHFAQTAALLLGYMFSEKVGITADLIEKYMVRYQ